MTMAELRYDLALAMAASDAASALGWDAFDMEAADLMARHGEGAAEVLLAHLRAAGRREAALRLVGLVGRGATSVAEAADLMALLLADHDREYRALAARLLPPQADP